MVRGNSFSYKDQCARMDLSQAEAKTKAYVKAFRPGGDPRAGGRGQKMMENQENGVSLLSRSPRWGIHHTGPSGGRFPSPLFRVSSTTITPQHTHTPFRLRMLERQGSSHRSPTEKPKAREGGTQCGLKQTSVQNSSTPLEMVSAAVVGCRRWRIQGAPSRTGANQKLRKRLNA